MFAEHGNNVQNQAGNAHEASIWCDCTMLKLEVRLLLQCPREVSHPQPCQWKCGEFGVVVIVRSDLVVAGATAAVGKSALILESGQVFFLTPILPWLLARMPSGIFYANRVKW